MIYIVYMKYPYVKFLRHNIFNFKKIDCFPALELIFFNM